MHVEVHQLGGQTCGTCSAIDTLQQHLGSMGLHALIPAFHTA